MSDFAAMLQVAPPSETNVPDAGRIVDGAILPARRLPDRDCKEPGAHGTRIVTARRGGESYFERVEWSVWAGHCHGQLWLPAFIARAIERAGASSAHT